jgi:hypothetical protein
MAGLDLDGRRMRAAVTDPQGVVSPETILVFEQAGDVVCARYRGGAIAAGRLVGRLDGLRTLRFCYAQTDRSGRLDAGISKGTLETMPDGRLRLVEEFQWLTRPERGTNVFEEEAP